MNTPVKTFPLPSSLEVVPGTERAQAAYPYTIQFGPGDDERFWFYNSMHFPEPMSAFDMVTAEAAPPVAAPDAATAKALHAIEGSVRVGVRPSTRN